MTTKVPVFGAFPGDGKQAILILTRSHLKSVFLIFKMSQKKAEFSHLKKLVPKNTEILRLFLQEM